MCKKVNNKYDISTFLNHTTFLLCANIINMHKTDFVKLPCSD